MLKTTSVKLASKIGPALGGTPSKIARAKAGRNIPPDLLHRRRAIRRSFIDARHEKNAIEHILKLPEEGESLHFVIDGRFEPCDIIPATRRLSDPATIERLTVTTLSFNADNIATICRGIDQGKIGSALVIPSHYFASVERALFEDASQELEQRGSRITCGKVHAKILLMEMSDGRCFTVEGSGNLRSCKSIEQFVMTNDRALLEWHRGWIIDHLQKRSIHVSREGRHTTRDREQGREGTTDSDVDT